MAIKTYLSVLTFFQNIPKQSNCSPFGQPDALISTPLTQNPFFSYVWCTFHFIPSGRKQDPSANPVCPELTVLIPTSFLWTFLLKYLIILLNKHLSARVNKGPPNESRQRLFIQSLLRQESQPPSVAFWQSLKGWLRSEKALEWRRRGKASDLPWSEAGGLGKL